MKYEISATHATANAHIGIVLQVRPELKMPLQGYELQISPNCIEIQAPNEVGIFYGSRTVIQLMQNYLTPSLDGSDLPDQTIPCLNISDWPDFPNRAIMLDVSRNKVPTMETMFGLIDLLASWKINQLQLYTEHTFAYQNHPDVWQNASPFTGEEILLLDAFCRERFVELVPNQNSFGHLEHWLKLPRYISLAESPDGFDLPWEHHHGPFSLCPLDPGSIGLVSSMYDELLPHFTSRQINVGCDETFDLGQGRSKEACSRLGTGRIYLDFLLKIYREVIKREHLMQFWGDIIIGHPELISEIPKDSIALEWGYEATHPFKDHAEILSHANLPFYVCPGTSSWNSIAGRSDNCIQNLTSAAINGLEFGANGYLIADWGDNGHWQVLPTSYLGFALGAALAWSTGTNTALDITTALSRFAFHDPTNIFGKLAYSLGNIYQKFGIIPYNSSTLFEILQQPFDKWQDRFMCAKITDELSQVLDVLNLEEVNLSNAKSNQKDRDVLHQEYELTIDLLKHACMRGLFAFGSSKFSSNLLKKDLNRLKNSFESTWLARNRPGGLQDSLSYFDIPMQDYL